MHPSHLDLDPLLECSASPLGAKVIIVIITTGFLQLCPKARSFKAMFRVQFVLRHVFEMFHFCSGITTLQRVHALETFFMFNSFF